MIANAFAGELLAEPHEEAAPRPKCKRRAMPLEHTPHRFFWYGDHVKRDRVAVEDQEILR
jgi:hypothetical protein